jgi:hypothetical protein
MAAKEILSALIVSEMNKQYTDPEGKGCDSRFADALASAIIDYLKFNAIVNVTSVSGVTTGPGVSGPGTGTITFI